MFRGHINGGSSSRLNFFRLGFNTTSSVWSTSYNTGLESSSVTSGSSYFDSSANRIYALIKYGGTSNLIFTTLDATTGVFVDPTSG